MLSSASSPSVRRPLYSSCTRLHSLSRFPPFSSILRRLDHLVLLLEPLCLLVTFPPGRIPVCSTKTVLCDIICLYCYALFSASKNWVRERQNWVTQRQRIGLHCGNGAFNKSFKGGWRRLPKVDKAAELGEARQIWISSRRHRRTEERPKDART